MASFESEESFINLNLKVSQVSLAITILFLASEAKNLINPLSNQGTFFPEI